MNSPIYLISAFTLFAALTASCLPDLVRSIELPHERSIVKPAAYKPFSGDPEGPYINSVEYYEYLSKEE